MRLITPITLTNSQSAPTPTPFQQMIQVPMQFRNGVRLWSPTDGQLYAWLEGISGGTATIWVKIPSSIPAGGTYQLYMIQDSTMPMDGVYWGEAPQLSSTYAQYDNGANVFIQYFNMQSNPVAYSAGASVSNWQITTGTGPTGSSQPLLYNNYTGGLMGATFTQASSNYPSSFIVDAWTKTDGYSQDIGVGASTTASAGNGYVADPGANYNALYSSLKISDFTSFTFLASTSYNQSANTWYLNEFQYISGGTIKGYVQPWSNTLIGSSGSPTTISGSDATYTSFSSVLVFPYQSSATYSYWALVVVRAYPPNGVMPSVFLGAPQYSGELITVTVP